MKNWGTEILNIAKESYCKKTFVNLVRKNILKIKDLTFEVIEAGEFLCIAMSPEMAQKYHKSDCGKTFVAVMDGYAKEVFSLPLNYIKKPIFGFVVLPQGEVFQSLTTCPFPKGMCGINADLDDVYTKALAVDEIWFEKGFSKKPDNEQKIGLVHELSHVVHGAYFQKMGCLGEGFAELLPHYLMDIENEKHVIAIKNINAEALSVLGFLNKNGMFSDPKDKELRAQYRSSYLSAYLWMLAYVKRLKKIGNFDKFGAVNFMLERFAELDKLSWAERMKGAAELVQLSEEECFGALLLQKEGIIFSGYEAVE